MSKKKVLSLFSGCGGMDIGFEGGFKCLKKSINSIIHPNWIQEDMGNWVKVAKTGFETVFANDIRPDAKAAWVSYFSKIHDNANEIYRVESIVDLVKLHKDGNNVFPHNIDVVTDENLEPHRLYDIGVVQFKYKPSFYHLPDDTEMPTVIGMIADDIDKIYPCACEYDEDTGEVVNWLERYMIPPMLYLIQEHQREIESLQCKIKKLERKIS